MKALPGHDIHSWVIAPFLLLLLFCASPAKAAIDAPFDSLQWKAWPVVITGPDTDERYIRQMELFFNYAQGLIARDAVVIRFHNRLIAAQQDLSAFPYRSPIDRDKDGDDERRHLERQLGADDDVFSVVLVGKDGSIVSAWTEEPVHPREIFALIDNAPLAENKTDVKRKPFEVLKNIR